ncbi:MAG: transglycosylase SLT domain-containing protein [Gammaproteobacteria bacterium]|nr:transglycosylase SLT domain-containing protein [Gammaproteobacteria bacterium]
MKLISQHRMFKIIPAAMLGLGLLWPSISLSYDKNTYAEQRKDYIAAEKALKNRQITRYRRIASRLKNYPLYPYLEYEEIRRRLGQTSSSEIQTFLEVNRHSPLSNKLRHAWLKSLARKKKWRELVDNFYLVNDSNLRCNYARALFELGDHRAIDVSKELWRTGKSLPNSCNYAFQALRDAGILNNELVWERIRLTMTAGRPRLAKYLARTMLNKQDQKWVNLWAKVRRKPELVDKVHELGEYEQLPAVRWMLVDGIRSMARRDDIKAAERWLELLDEYEFTATERHRAERRLVYKLKQRNEDYADKLLKKLGPAALDDKVLDYYVLSALRDKDWRSALDWLGQLSSDSQHTVRWQYWRARALESLGHMEEARGLYLLNANDRSYYSFLAADRAGLSYKFAHKPLTYSGTDFASLKEEPALLRAGELFFLKRIVEARREWNAALTQMDGVQRLKAASLAHEMGWHDRAIVTLAQAEYWDDLEMRFPLAHQQLVLKHATKTNINPAWAFAIIRQESAFTADARSHAGALGLMQLMPGTARQVARSMQLRRPRQNDILNIKTNVRLGVQYLKKVNDKFDGNAVLATAAYNAGHHRVKQWIPEQGVLPADVWVELVPFKETREYLQRVMTYMVIYENRLGQDSIPLLKRMMPILGKNPLTVLSKDENIAIPGV